MLTDHKSHLRDDWSSEILLGLRAVLFKLSIWDHNASYGAALQNLRYTDARHRGSASKAPAQWQKAIYGLVTVGGRYVWERWESWLVEQEGGYDEVRGLLAEDDEILLLLISSSQLRPFVCIHVYHL